MSEENPATTSPDQTASWLDGFTPAELQMQNAHCLHSHCCGQLRLDDVGVEVTLTGWVDHRRDHGGLIFVDLRDRSGVAQVVFDPDAIDAAGFKAGETMRPEWVILVRGKVRPRPGDTANPNMPTGEVEVLLSDVQILNSAKTPPFAIADGSNTEELARLHWRYLDIRRPEVLRALILRSQITTAIRRAMDERGFIDIETPVLGRSTPEGARDFLVPSRLNHGSFYALPQSPQLYKQLLMVGGVERYYQIARCFRDEDLRADRQPEFTQLDVEMSFIEGEDVMNLIEEVMAEVFAVADFHPSFPLKRITYAESMARFGNDRPDTRFGLELVDISDILGSSDFKVFASAVAAGGVVKAINAKGAGDLSRGEIDKIAGVATDHGAKGMAWIAFTAAGEVKSPIVKFFSEAEFAALRERLDVENGDLVVFGADDLETVSAALSAVRLYLADLLQIDRGGHTVLWVVDFPMFSYDPEAKRYVANHHPFTRIKDEDLDKIETDPLACGSYSYDMVLDGFEIGGGTLRNHTRDAQLAVLKALGFSEAEATEQFGFLLEALGFGAPPHGGIAFGLDRLVMILGGYSSIRETIAFPKTSSGGDPMTGAPAQVAPNQLREAGIRLI